MPSSPLSDFFDDSASWEVVASGQAKGQVTRAEGPNGQPALRLDFNFHGGGGFVVARKQILLSLPETFELRISLRGTGLPNHFEFKVADPSGSNAWRYLRENFELPATWTELALHERDLPFAWGPAGGGAPNAVGAMEFVIAAGPGGEGSVWLSEITLEDQTARLPEKVSASSHLANRLPAAVFASPTTEGWQAAANDPNPQWTADFGRLVRFGGLTIDWPSPLPPRAFEISLSKDAGTWVQVYQATQTMGRRSHIPTPGAEARSLRITFSTPECAALVALQLRPDAFSRTPNEFIHSVAAEFPRGWFPRYWHREQSYWTPVGSPEGKRRALINEEGLVEVDEAGFSLEPFLVSDNALITWAEAEIKLSLPPDGSPFPVVSWQAGGINLTIQPWIDGAGDALVLRVTYQISNASGHPIRLAVAVRPFQVNPPWQAFRNLGGISPIHRISCDPMGMQVDGRRVSADRLTDDCGASTFEEGGVVGFLARGELPTGDTVHDPSGLASAALSWDLPPGDALFEVTVSVPFFKGSIELAAGGLEDAMTRWHKVLAPVEWRVPPSAHNAIACFRTAASHILINRDGPAIQPGPRRYTRSWMRDCVIMGSAMAKAGHPQVLREFLLWYVRFLRDDGHVPCVVDRDGVDKLVEHDSHGQFLWGIREVFRNHPDLDFAESIWIPVSRAANYLQQLRALRTTQEFQAPARSACYGLLPESASHEGYLAHPVHSYWDDFWGIRGLEAAADLASELGHQDAAQRWRHEAQALLNSVLHSIRQVILERNINYIPGSVEWADFDPTATSNAIAQLDFADELPPVPLGQMLETYHAGFLRKHRGGMPWLNYTAYEIRIIGAFVRTGNRDRANELLDFFLSDRRPIEWNQWPEITWRDPRAPGHLGDVPHTWIAAEYMLALASMVASEREATGQMVLASGLPWSWISEKDGFFVRGLMTRFGPLDFTLAASRADEITFTIRDCLSMPPGGLSVAPPLPNGKIIHSAIPSEGEALTLDPEGRAVIVRSLPVTATLFLGLDNPPTLS